jgi:hypothetical protein
MVNESSDGKVPPKALVISCYPWEWQEVLTIEGAIEFQQLGYQVNYVDFSSFSGSFAKNFTKTLLGRKLSKGKKDRFLKSFGVTSNYPTLSILKARVLLLVLKLTPYDFRSTCSARWENIYPGLVDETGDPQASADKYPKLTRKLAIEDLIFNKLLENCFKSTEGYVLALIVNGRFPLNRSAGSFFRQNIEVNFIEFGANREKFQIYSTSPHSIKNRKELFRKYFDGHEIPMKIIEREGRDFFLNRKRFDNQANIEWTRNMTPEKLPKLDASKKTCTFFPTSEKEFAGVADIPNEDHFRNQFEALDSLIACLGNEWDIYIRRHPKAHDSTKDAENELWNKYQYFSNVHVIPPDSPVDSYSLGMQSNLVAHYSSFIGPELIFAGHNHVITLGPTLWEDLDEGRHIHNSTELKKYLRNPGESLVRKKILYVGYFMGNFGKPFRCISWNPTSGNWLFKEN